MGKRRGPLLTELPEVIHPEMRLTVDQVMRLRGCGRTKLHEDTKAGIFPKPEKTGRFVRWRAGDVLDAMNRGRS